jgi:ATP-dependent Lon protease
VLPVGGVKEKVLAARRVGLREVILPRQNEKNVKEDFSDDLRRDIRIHLVSAIDEVLALALNPPLPDRAAEPATNRAVPEAAHAGQ